MLRGSFILGVLLSLSCLVLGDAPADADGILKDLGISKEKAVTTGLWEGICQALKAREALKVLYTKHNIYIDYTRGGLRTETWEYQNFWNERYYGSILPALRNQVALVDMQKQQKEQAEQLKEQAQKIDKLVAGNAQFIQFLVMMDSAITSERDIRARVEAAKQLLESDLVDEQQKVLLLNNKIKELKEKAETVAVENAELRAQMQAELEAIQVQLKERMLSMM